MSDLVKVEKTSVFDLAALDTRAACDIPTEIELRHPGTKKPLGMFISVLGRDSAVYKAKVLRLRNDSLKAAQLAQRKRRDAEVVTAEEIDEKAIDLIVAATVGWRDGVSNKETFTVDGKELAFNAVNAFAFYERFEWAKEQVDDFMGDIENFITSK
jgi:hypothetical protein